LLNISTGQASFLLNDPRMDNRFLAWDPAGEALYLKVGTLSDPQVLRFTVADRRSQALPVSPNTYDLTVSPDKTILYAFSNGIGFGSEAWLLDETGNQRQILSDAKNILGLFRYAPDGKHIAYLRLPDSNSTFPAGKLWVMDADGQNARLAATADGGRGMPPAWSPAGDQIAFIGRNQPGNESPNLSIYNMSNARLLTLDFSPLTPPVWSLDGLYFTLAAGDTMELWFYATASGKAHKVTSGACCAGWIH
jgi:Tol biopolymer transport system component